MIKMKQIRFVENQVQSKADIISKAEINEMLFNELIQRRIVCKTEKRNRILYYFSYVGAIFTTNNIIYVLPKTLLNEEVNESFIGELIKLFIAYSKRENLLVEEKEYLGVDSQNDRGSLLSIINYIMQDYIDNGLYIKKKNIKEVNGNGEVNWNKTIQRDSMYLNNKKQPVYHEVVSNKKNIHSSLIITKIHKKILNKCNEIINRLSLETILNYKVDMFEIDDFEIDGNEYMLEHLQQELDYQYEDKKIELLEILISFIKKINVYGNDLELSLFGTRYFDRVWEKMNSYIFRNQYNDIKQHIPKPKWYSETSKKNIERDTLIPDILYLDSYNKELYILDAKYYTTNFKDEKLKGTIQGIGDIIKQLVYEDVLLQFYKGYSVINAFIIPTSQHKEKFGKIIFPISNTGETIQLIHLNIYEVINMYLSLKKYNIEEFRSELKLRVNTKNSINDMYKDIKPEEVLVKESKKEYIVKEEFKDIEQKYSNDKLDILLRLLKIKFEYLDEIYIKKIKILSDKAIDKIIDDIFNINNIDELNKYFK